jgi:S-adenosylmethionine/arginine decarboxylase-like enzyme
LTSSIVIHTLDLMAAVYINIFSCNYFNEKVALEFTKKWFSSNECTSHYIERI